MLLANIAKPASWLSDEIVQGVLPLPASASLPLARLLLSCAATELKAARVAGVEPGPWIFEFMDAAVFSESNCVALFPALISLLLPRLAATVPTSGSFFAYNTFMFTLNMCHSMETLPGCNSLTILLLLTSCHSTVHLNQAVAEVAVLSGEATRLQAYWAAKILARYASRIAQLSLVIVRRERSCGLSPTEIHARLAQPILMLLRSPLLGLLASLQHVAVGSCENIQSFGFPEDTGIPTVHLLPAHMQPDAVDSKVVMQVGLPFSRICLRTAGG